MEKKIRFHSVADIQEFVSLLQDFQGDVDIVQGRMAVDAKSILGVCSLDMKEDMYIRVYVGNCDELCGRIARFLAD